MRNSLLFGGQVCETSAKTVKKVLDPFGKIYTKKKTPITTIKASKKRVGIKPILEECKKGDVVSFQTDEGTISLGVVKECSRGTARNLRVQLFDNVTFNERNFYLKTEVIKIVSHDSIGSRVGLKKTNVDNTFYLPESERSRILGRQSVIQRKFFNFNDGRDDDDDENDNDSEDEIDYNEKRIMKSKSEFRVSRFQRKKWEKAEERAVRVMQRQEKIALLLGGSKQQGEDAPKIVPKKAFIKKPKAKVIEKVAVKKTVKRKIPPPKRSKSPPTRTKTPAKKSIDLADIMDDEKTQKKQFKRTLSRKQTLRGKSKDEEEKKEPKKQEAPKKKPAVFKFFNRKASLRSSSIKPSKQQEQEEKRAAEVEQNKGKIGHEDLCVISNSFGTHQREFKDKYDVIFVLDTTGSMSSSLPKVVKAIGDIVQNISSISDLSAKFGCVSYTDHAPDDGGYGNPPVKYFPHDTLQSDDNKKESMKFVRGLRACGGGGAGGQAVVDGLHYANTEIPFREGSERMYILVLDQGPHGEQFAGAKYQFPKGCPCGIDWKQKLGQMKENNVEFLFVKCGGQLQRTVKLFGDTYGDKWSVMSLDDFQKFDEKIVNYVCGLVRHNYKLSKK